MANGDQSGAFAPLSARRQLPPLQPEDYRKILQTLAAVGWIILGLALGLEAWIRSSESLIWPQMDHFSERYNAIAALYGISNAILSFLLSWRGWLEAKPRLQRKRLRALLAAVLLRDAAVLIWFTHISGSVQGPMAMGLPFLVIAAYMILPRGSASAFSALLTAGCIAIVVLERQGVISFPGMLARAFDVQGVSAVPGTIVLLAFVAASFVFGNFARTRLNEAGTMIHRRSVLDSLTGLFGREFFEHRLADELDRARRNGRAVTVLVCEIQEFYGIVERSGLKAAEEILAAAGEGILQVVRTDSDTPARIGPSSFAIVLPNTPADGALVVARRLSARFPGPPGGRFKFALGVATSPGGLADAWTLLETAENALQKAAKGTGDGIEAAVLAQGAS